MTTVALGSLVEIRGGGTPSRENGSYWGGKIPWASVKDFKGYEISQTQESITVQGLVNSASNLIPAGSIIVPTRMAVGKAAINTVDVAINQDLKALMPLPGVEPRYLLHCLLNSAGKLERRATGATVKGITLEVLRDLPIRLPSPPEQRRIATILDQVDALRTKRRTAVALLDDMERAIFVEMFGEPIANTMQWPEEIMLGAVTNISSGITKGRKLNGPVSRSVPYLAVSNVQDRALNLGLVKTIEASDDEIERYRLLPGDIVLTEGGDPDKLGRGTLWKGEIADCIHQNHIFRVRRSSPDFNNVFLLWLIGSERGKRYFLRSAKQTTGIASINMTQLRAFPLFRPPLSLQDRFESILHETSVSRTKLWDSQEKIDSLFTSLQHRAFRGEL